MNRLISILALLVVCLAFLRAAGSLLIQAINALSVLGVVVGVAVVAWQITRYYTRQ